MQKTRVAVVGVGHHGERHVRILSALDGVDLVGIVDVDRDRLNAVAERYGVAAFADAAAIMEHVDAVTVAVPTISHVSIRTRRHALIRSG